MKGFIKGEKGIALFLVLWVLTLLSVIAGEFGDSFRWKSAIIRIEQAEDEEAKLPFNTFNITVDVMWNEGDKEKHFEISTMKVVEKKKE